MDGWMDGWMDGLEWIDIYLNVKLRRCLCLGKSGEASEGVSLESVVWTF